jgi:hypothetical protein
MTLASLLPKDGKQMPRTRNTLGVFLMDFPVRIYTDAGSC